MPFEPEKITREHITLALESVANGNLSLKPSTKFDVIINNKAYPPRK
jgi:hypothetical protein